MRRNLPLAVLLGVVVAAPVASAKLPSFDLEVAPTRLDVGGTVTLTMTCFEDADHTRPWMSAYVSSAARRRDPAKAGARAALSATVM